MRVSRREFFRLAGATMASAVVPKGMEGEATGIAEHTNRVGVWYTRTHPPDDSEGWYDIVMHESSDYYTIYRDGELLSPEEQKAFAQSVGLLSSQRYDCDYYFPVSQGETTVTWVSPLDGIRQDTVLEWYDHGRHTHLMTEGCWLGSVPSVLVGDVEGYLHSIWAAGQVAAGIILSDRG